VISMNTDRIEYHTRNWIAYGFFVYLCGFFVLEKGYISPLFWLFVILPVFVLGVVSRGRCVQDKRIVFICAAFLGYLALSALWGEGNFFKAIRYALYTLCLLLAVEIVTQKISERLMVKFIIAIGLIAAISYMVAILLSDRTLVNFMNDRFSFFTMGGWGNKNPIDSGIIIGLPVIAAWYFSPGKRWHIKLLLAATILLCVMLMFVTKSRSPMIATAITLLCITLYRREKSDFFLLFLSVALIGGSLMLFNDFSEVIINRFKEENYRPLIWREEFGLFMNHWLIGQGYGTSANITSLRVSHSHNFGIEVLRVGGIIGGLLFIHMLVSMVRPSYIHSGNIFYLFWLFFGMVCLAMNGRLLLIRPQEVEFFGFWLPLFLFYFSRKHRCINTCT